MIPSRVTSSASGCSLALKSIADGRQELHTRKLLMIVCRCKAFLRLNNTCSNGDNALKGRIDVLGADWQV